MEPTKKTKKQLSKNFTLDELIQSDTVDARNSDANPNNDIDNTPTLAQEKNLDELADFILQPLRDYLGYPIEISSGFRGPELNKVVKGAKTSDHCSGNAADIQCNEMRKAFLYIQDHLPFSELIWEEGNDCKPKWIHVSYENPPQREVLRKRVGSKTYEKFHLTK